MFRGLPSPKKSSHVKLLSVDGTGVALNLLILSGNI